MLEFLTRIFEEPLRLIILNSVDFVESNIERDFIMDNVPLDSVEEELLSQWNFEEFCFESEGMALGVRVDYNLIRGTNRRDRQDDWLVLDDGSIDYIGRGTVESDNLVRLEHRESLVQGWPEPYEENDYIHVKRIPLDGREVYYIVGNGNSRVAATWRIFKDDPALKEGYQFVCKIVQGVVSENYNLIIRVIELLKRLDYTFTSISLYSLNQDYFIVLKGDSGKWLEFKVTNDIISILPKLVCIMFLPKFIKMSIVKFIRSSRRYI